MQTNEFRPVHLNHLTIDNLFSLSTSTIECASPVRESIGELPKVILDQFETDNNAMGARMKKALKNPPTAQVTELDLDSDDRFAEVKRNVKTNLQGRNPENKAAAEALKIFLGPYWDTDTKPLNTQTSLMKEMFGKFNASETLNTHAATIGITDMMAGLETANTALGTLYQARNEQVSAAEGPSASNLKSATAKTYEQFCNNLLTILSNTKNKLILLVFITINGITVVYSQQDYPFKYHSNYLRISVTDSIGNEPIDFVSILNKRNNGWIKTDSLGLASIKVFQGDTLEISCIGFFPKIVLVTDSMLNNLTPTKIRLEEQVYLLDEVKIFPFRSYQDLKYQILHLKLDPAPATDEYKYNKKSPSGFHPSAAPFSIALPFGGMGGMGGTFLIGGKFKQKMKLMEATENQKKYDVIDAKYNTELVIKITHLEGAQLDSFIMKYRPPEQFLINATEYDIVAYILNRFEVYKLQLDSLKK